MPIADVTISDGVDPEGMRHHIAATPDHIRLGHQLGLASGLTRPPESGIVFAGMGGSGIGGELVRALISGSAPVPITRVRGFGIPLWAGPRSLVIVVSYSGNTDETLACADQAIRQGAQVLAVTSGGALADLATTHGMALVRLPGGMPPRAAIGLLFGALCGGLAACGLMVADGGEQAARGSAAVDLDQAREIGIALAHRTPLFYGGGPLGAVAYRWKTQFNENAKVHAFSHSIPEMGHNEIEAWPSAGSGAGGFAPVLLREHTLPGPLTSYAQAIESALVRAGHPPILVTARGETTIERAFNLVSTGDWASFFAALERGVDPTVIPSIAGLKESMAAAQAG